MATINPDEMYREQSKMVFAFLYSMCKNYHLAEDLTQDTFLKAYKNIDKFDQSKKLSTWLCEIAKNLYIDYLRRHKNREIPDDLLVSDALEQTGKQNSPTETIAAHEIMRLVHSLDEPYKEIFLLRYSMGLSFSDIADIFGKNESWVRLIYYRSRKILQKMIEEMSV